MTEPTPDTDDEVTAVVVAVDGDGDEQMVLGEEALAQTVDTGREELRATISVLQQELSGMARTGVPGVDDALDQLSGLDPDDLEGSAELLTQVLQRLETVMSRPE